MPSPNASLYQMFKLNPNAFPGVNPGAFANDANEEISSMAPSNESMRERGILDEADARASAGINNDLAHSNAVRSAREDHGYNSPYPLEEADQAALDDKLKMILLPEQVKLKAAHESADEARIYSAMEHEKDRQLRADIAAGTQQGQTQRSTNSLTQQDQHFQQAHPQSGLAAFFGFGKKPSTSPPSPGSMEEPTVKIQDPNSGEVRDIPQSRAQAVIARGGIQVQ